MGMYAKAKEKFLSGAIDLTADDIRAILVDAADYTANEATDEFLTSVAAGARVAVSGALASKVVTNGVFDAADVVLSAVTGDQSEEIVIYKHTGVEATSPLIARITAGTGLPVTPNGGDITIQWDSGANKIFAL